MGKSKVREEKCVSIGSKTLTLQEKLVILRERLKWVGDSVYVSLGVTKLSYSRWVNTPGGAIRKDMKEKLIEVSEGFITREDFGDSSSLAPSPAPIAADKPKKRAKPVVAVEEEFEFIF